eukprot:TRINITY_DN2240_c0_g2_i1.p1 TRINITY_DN2240_c0_g2~~TRINITY_DN2240_c0_g2_i1.p1  ORF type:complete len:267 (-),score=47.56 TRINITY_DN2240_c0_g2_i1:9-809(-)
MSALEIGGIPCLIRETYYAPPCPEEIAATLEVALTHHNAGDYSLAVKTYLQAQQKWEIELNGEYEPIEALSDAPILPTEARLFLRLAIGAVFESAGSDEQALAEYVEARAIAQVELPTTHPINATTHSAIGCVYVHLSQFDLAVDNFLKALDLREQVLGQQHVDTGMVLNNVGVCLHCMDHTADALQMYYKAEEIFELHFALEHPRLVTVRRNIQRAKTSFLKNSQFSSPEFKPYRVPFTPGAVRSRTMLAKLNQKKPPKKVEKKK